MLDVDISQMDAEHPIPSYARPGDAGADLCANESVILAPRGGRGLIGTGLKLAIPLGYAGFVLPRSGLALNHGITCLNTPGLIDAGYRGEIKVLLINTDSTNPYEVHIGDRIAQLVIMKVQNAQFNLVDENELGTSERAAGGFGHSGR